MKQIRNRFTIPTAVIVMGGIYLWTSGSPSRNAQEIVPGTSFETVFRLLGNPQNKEEMEGMALCSFRPNFAAAGPIKVGFDKNWKAVYLKIWEDAPPQWDLRKGDNLGQSGKGEI
jgi:hypothetical protein